MKFKSRYFRVREEKHRAPVPSSLPWTHSDWDWVRAEAEGQDSRNPVT